MIIENQIPQQEYGMKKMHQEGKRSANGHFRDENQLNSGTAHDLVSS